MNKFSKIMVTGLILGLGIQTGYGSEESSTPFPKGAFVRYSAEPTIGSFSISLETNMVHQAPYTVTGNTRDIKSMYLDHWDERECFPETTMSYIRGQFPQLEELTVICPAAQNIEFRRLRSETLKTLQVDTQAKNLNDSLQDLPNSTPNLEKLGIHSNQLNSVGIRYISFLEKLRTFSCSTHTFTLPKNALTPLAEMKSLKRVNYGSWNNTGGYTALIDLYKARQSTGLPL